MSDPSSRNGFAFNPLNRLSERREDASYIASLRRDPQARSFVQCGDQIVLHQHQALMALGEVEDLGTPRQSAFLGLHQQVPWFFTLFGQSEAETLIQRGLELTELRRLLVEGLLAPEQLGALGQGKSLMHWHRGHRYCGRCGQETTVEAAGWRRTCPNCGHLSFPRTDPVVIMLAVHGHRCLLGRQPRFPAGMYSCLAGFLEPGETIEDAVRRELREEAGVRTGAVTYHSSQPWPFPGSLMIGALAQAQDDALILDHDELEDARWFTRDEAAKILAGQHDGAITSPPPGAIAHQILKSWVEDTAA
ncbi:MAG: NAD(+) diphosphatase [Hyphomicrobiales bacterium]|nr:NAD(+) diphosphatase [Hyphomicrobiales bacterium]